MHCRLRNVALLLLVLVLAAGLASAQGLKVTQVGSSGAVTQTTFSPSSVSAKAPTPRADGTFNYWDALASTNYYDQPSYTGAPPNPQVGVGPDDILILVNRTLARYPNPNAAGNTGAGNPNNYQPTHKTFLETWVGVTDKNALCPSFPQTANTCVFDNASIRYDQMQGRFVVVFTVTDVPAHRSNIYLAVSRFADFACSTTSNPNPTACTGTSDLFTPPIVPIFGGPETGSINGNWYRYLLPINVTLPATPVTTGSTTLTVDFCANGGPTTAGGTLPTAETLGPITTGCTDYFPTGARFGLDNDNIIVTAPVIDMSQQAFNLVSTGFPGGPYAGTRVITLPKLVAYNGTPLPGTITQPPACQPATCTAVNLTDNVLTGTLTAVNGGTLAAPTSPCVVAGAASAACSPASTANPITPIFWEPDNLRGRALASFNSQVGPAGSAVAGVITPIDYLVGTQITNDVATGTPLTVLPTPTTTVNNQIFFIQPIVFTCPGSAIFSAPSSVTFCGVAGGGAGGQVPDLPVLGVRGTVAAPIQYARTNNASLAPVTDPGLVAQGPYTSTPATTPIPSIFVGDARPQQVIFREGLLYVARTARLWDSLSNPAGAATVIYDIISQAGPTCATAAAASGPFCGATPSSPYSTTGVTIPTANTVFETEWFNGQSNLPDTARSPKIFGFYAPMYDVPANVVSTGPASPIGVFAYLEKLFVGMTTGGTANVLATFSTNNPSLWDFRPGDDVYDTNMNYLNPVTGVTATALIPYGFRGGAATDPNDGSLWLYGAFAKKRESNTFGPGQWGTRVANYALDFPASDPYNNDNSFFADVQPGAGFFTWIQIAKNLGIAASKGSVTCPATPPGNPPLVPPVTGNSGGGTTPSAGLTCGSFGPDDVVTRSEMAKWVVLAQMDEAQVNTYLSASGGIPGCGTTPGGKGPWQGTCTKDQAGTDPRFSSFADTIGDANIRYIEVMARRGYTKGCGFTTDARAMYCPTLTVRRGEMSVFIIRAKMNNVFPTTLSGIPLSAAYGDNFGDFLQTNPNAGPAGTPTGGAWFTDVPTTHGFFLYIQKMRELRITNGTSLTTYAPDATLTRGQIATFIVRAFFL